MSGITNILGKHDIKKKEELRNYVFPEMQLEKSGSCGAVV